MVLARDFEYETRNGGFATDSENPHPLSGGDDLENFPTPYDAGPTISVVIPAKNEAANVGWVLRGLPDCVDEVILVDGNSTDNTVEAAQRERPDLVVVQQERPGKGAALRQGFASASCDIVVMIDADGSMDPGEIEKYVEPLATTDCELVKGSRWMDGGGSTDITPIRRLGNRALLGLVNTTFRCRFTELCYGFMAFKRPVVSSLGLTADGFEIETEIVVNAVMAGLKVEEVPSVEVPRRHGESNLRPVRDGLRVLRTVMKAAGNATSSPRRRRSTPLHLKEAAMLATALSQPVAVDE